MKNLKKTLIIVFFVVISSCYSNYLLASETVFKVDYFGNPEGTKELNLDVDIGTTYLFARLDNAQQLIQEKYGNWTKEFPQWKVNLNAYKPSQERPTKLLEQLKAGNAPDCSTVDSFQVSLFKKYLQPIEPYFSKSQLDDLFHNFRTIATDENNHLLFWWYTTDIRLIYYFKDFMDGKLNTWAEFEKSLEKAHELHPKLIPFLVAARRYESTSNDWYAYFWQQGGRLIDDDGKPVFGDKNNLPKMVKALNFYKNLSQKELIPKSVGGIESIRDIVGGRKIIAWQDGNWNLFRHKVFLESQGNGKYASQIGIAQQPSYNGKDYATSTGGWTFVIFTKDKEKAKACAGFIRHVFAGPFNKISGELPTVYSAYKEGVFAQPVYQKFKEIAVNSGHSRPNKVVYPETSVEIQGIISRILSGEDFDIEKAVNNAYKKIIRSYNRLARRKKS